MGRAKALRLGIVKGLQHTAAKVLPKEWKCPICKYQFNAYDVAVESKETGISPEEIVAGHIKSCIRIRFPNQKSKCYDCSKQGKTTTLTISELDKHVAEYHSEEGL